jgi:long-chain acyl-CoA synthetase
MIDKASLFLGVISGRRRRAHAEVSDRADRIAGG